jgi:cell division septum initiation protein DivIVA
MMKKWFKRIGITVAAIFLILLVLPFAFKGKIMKMVQEGASASVNAKISFDDDLSLSLIRNFPNLSVGVNNLKVIGVDSFKQDTLFSAPEIRMSIDISSLLGGNKPISIRRIYLKQPRLNVVVLKSGRANYDIAKPDTSTVIDTSKSAPISLKLKDVEIEDGNIAYNDQSMGFEMVSGGSNLMLQGDFANNIFIMNTQLSSKNLNMSYGGMTLVSKSILDVNTNIDVDLNKMRFAIKDIAVKMNELPLDAKGWLEMHENNMDMDFAINAPTSDFKAFLSVVPGCYTNDFSNVKTSGKMGIKFGIKGIMDSLRMPTTNMELKVENGSFQYPTLPAGVTGINVDFKFNNADGNPDHTIVNLSKFQLNFGGEPLDAKLYLSTPISNAYAKGSLKTALHLEKWLKLMPLEQNTSLKGNINADFNFEGHYSEIVPGKMQDLNAAGQLMVNGLYYTSPSTLPLSLNNLKVTINPKEFDLASMDLGYGKSTISASGKITNMLGYAFNGETLHGNLMVSSKSLDLNEWMNSLPKSTEPAKVDTSSAPMSAVELPKNIDFTFTATAGKMIYQTYILTGCVAKATINKGILNIDPIRANLWGSTFEMNKTSYSYEKGGDPKVASSIILLNLNPKNITNNIELVNKYAPILKEIEGMANLNMGMKTNLTQEMGVDMNSVFADGNLDLMQGIFNIPNWMGEAAKYFNWDSKKIEVQPSNYGFAIANGELTLKDSIKLTMPRGSKMSIIGKVGLDQKVDFGGKLSSDGKSLPFKITGTIAAPKLVIDWKSIGKGLIQPKLDKVKEDVMNKANAAADKVLDKARQEADQIRKTAKEKADQIRNESRKLADRERQEGEKLATDALNKANAETDKLMDKAKNPIEKFAAEKAVKAIKKEAEKKSAQIRSNANSLADKTIVEADKKAELVESEADKKASSIIQNAEEQRNKMNKK